MDGMHYWEFWIGVFVCFLRFYYRHESHDYVGELYLEMFGVFRMW